MSPDDTTTTDWTVEDLHQLRGGDEPGDPPGGDPRGGELVHVPTWTQSAWDRHQVRQLRAAEDAEAYLWANQHKTDTTLIRDALLILGYHRAAGEHMGATSAAEDGRSLYAAMYDRKRPAARKRPARKRPAKTVVVEPTAVHTPGRRRKPGGAS